MHQNRELTGNLADSSSRYSRVRKATQTVSPTSAEARCRRRFFRRSTVTPTTAKAALVGTPINTCASTVAALKHCDWQFKCAAAKNRCTTFTTFTRSFVFMSIEGEYRGFDMFTDVHHVHIGDRNQPGRFHLKPKQFVKERVADACRLALRLSKASFGWRGRKSPRHLKLISCK